ncbi:MAG: alpha-E domain-containing protein [Candidatus Dormibacteria bacterium]
MAQSLHRMGRLMERAEHVARVLDVYVSTSLDTEERDRTSWAELVELCGLAAEGGLNRARAAEALVGGERRSIRASLTEMHALAQSVRPSLPSELYFQLNILRMRVAGAMPTPDLHEFLEQTQMGLNLLTGLVEDRMARDESWDFLRLGKHLERAESVTRLVTHRHQVLAGVDDALTLATTLRCCSSFEAYRWRFSAPVTAESVAGFLLLDSAHPRSSAFCVQQALAAVRRIDGHGARREPHRILGRMSALFDYADEREVAADPLAFANSFTTLSMSLDAALANTYFQPSHIQKAAGFPPQRQESGQQ